MSKTSYLGRHRVVHVSVTARVARTGATAAATTAVAAASVGLLAGPAGAAPAHNWDGVAQCESTGNWHINTGNGFYGGLQFTRSTWLGYGGGAYASRADLASEAQQIAIAERVLRGQGKGAWPVCGAHLGSGSTMISRAVASHPVTHRADQPRTDTNTRTQVASRPARVDRNADRDDSHGQSRPDRDQYTVRSGDTLNRIATAHHTTGGWQALAHLNRTTIDNPNLIYPGQHVTL